MVWLEREREGGRGEEEGERKGREKEREEGREGCRNSGGREKEMVKRR